MRKTLGLGPPKLGRKLEEHNNPSPPQKKPPPQIATILNTLPHLQASLKFLVHQQTPSVMPSEIISTISSPFPHMLVVSIVVHRIPHKVRHTPFQDLIFFYYRQGNLSLNSLRKDMQGPPLQNS
ncbi:hypothetical protein ES319_D11G227600v1 [Gossypium barbadense]|uniref:Uncharacterized protein n=3 Tax=Gossypium TaxID=3633 RepID=A0A5J5PFE1_GOSBA|nr:hypothetical protein ES319_D11G227600v1 [Gossypium barbadense]